jgi:hypothetical protein
MEVDVDAQEDVTDCKFHSGDETEAESRHGADNTVQPKPPVCFAIFDDDTMLTVFFKPINIEEFLRLPNFRVSTNAKEGSGSQRRTTHLFNVAFGSRSHG